MSVAAEREDNKSSARGRTERIDDKLRTSFGSPNKEYVTGIPWRILRPSSRFARPNGAQLRKAGNLPKGTIRHVS